MFKVLVFICLGIFSYANNLSITNGSVTAHTEVFGDSEINPSTKDIKGELSIDNSIESIKGKIYFDTLSLISDKKDRDANMYELLEVNNFNTISFEISSISKNEDKYEIDGVLTLHGVTKNVSSIATITNDNGTIILNGDFSILLSNFGMKPPTLLFLTVRDQIDINYNIEIK